ncbi:MAG TPA: hypothetical protein VH592_24260 [Gemmataceae bacterium]|jgi:hypothetical protein
MRPKQKHLEIQENATESQAIISRGEDVLDRVHQVARGIEENIRHLLDASAPNPSLSNCYAGREPT